MTVALPRLAALVVAITISAGCGDPHHPRTYPKWMVGVTDPDEITWRDCAGLRGVVKRSGKAGVGIVLELRTRHDCPLQFARAEVVFDDGTRAQAIAPELPPLRGRSLLYLWLPVPFDGDEMWNRGQRRARLELELAINGVSVEPIAWPLFQYFDGPWANMKDGT